MSFRPSPFTSSTYMKPTAAEIEIGMPFPGSGARVGRRFEPAFGREDIVAAVAVHIADADAVAVAGGADDVFYEGSVLRFVPGERSVGFVVFGKNSRFLPSFTRST